MCYHLRWLALLVALIAVGCESKPQPSPPKPSPSPLTLVHDGQARAVVLVAADAPVAVSYAADELSMFIRDITGVTLERVSRPSPDRLNIAIGPGAAGLLDATFNTDGLTPDGIALKVIDGKGLILAGPDPRGTLYAVYTLLEDYCGCRWWVARSNYYPSRQTLQVPGDLDIRYTPPLEYRYPYWTEAFDMDWSVRNKANGSPQLDAARGGYTGHGGVHTFYRTLIPPDRYFNDHPEWFSQINGKRIHERAQLCLSNPAMRTELIKNLAAYIRQHPHPAVYSVSQNDWHGYCTCDQCNALAEKYGGQSGVMVWFVNQVAEQIEKQFPKATISTLAYQYTRKPPTGIRPRKNVVIQLCSIECSFSVPLTDARNAAFRDDIIGWSKTADRLYIWDYTTDFRHHFMPHPNLRSLGPNVRFFVEHHAAGIFEQGAYTTRGAEFAELRSWVLAKLLWDPTLDDQKLIREFCVGYYGPAAPHILQYIDLIHDAAAKAGEPAVCLPSYKHRFDYLTFDVMSKAWALMAQAEKAVKDFPDPDYALRVEQAKMPVMYAWLWRWPELKMQAADQKADWPIEQDVAEFGELFKTLAAKHRIKRVCEWYDGYELIDRAVDHALKSQ